MRACVNMLVIEVVDYNRFPNTGYSCGVEFPILIDLKRLLKVIFIIILGVKGP